MYRIATFILGGITLGLTCAMAKRVHDDTKQLAYIDGWIAARKENDDYEMMKLSGNDETDWG